MPSTTDHQDAYYSSLRKLSPTQVSEAYDKFNVPIDKRPTIAWLAHQYSVSYNTMFRHLHLERYRRQNEN